MRTPKELKERSAEDQREIRWLWRERLYVFSGGFQIFHAWPIVPSLISSRQRQSNMTSVTTVRVIFRSHGLRMQVNLYRSRTEREQDHSDIPIRFLGVPESFSKT